MKIKRFFAEDIRQAMRMVKEELGADAVIMSNKSVDGGVEIVAARDFDEQLIQSKLQKQAAEQQASANPGSRSYGFPANSDTSTILGGRETKKVDLPDFEAQKNRLHVLSSQRKQSADGFVPERPPVRRNIDQYVGYAEKVHLRGNMETVTAKVAKPVAPAVTQRPKQAERPMQIVIPPEKQSSPADNLLLEMSKELKSLRSAMDSKLSSVSWGAASQTNPVRADLLQRLAGMSISRKLSVKIANRFTNHTDPELVFSQAQELLAKVLPVAGDDLLQYGGIAALVGPTGVGKTTTIAKLAAKFILKHGPRQVALITTDNYRIGAHEQLNTYGRILDVPVRVASSAAELRNLINGFSDKRLILIDTAGMSQRDMKLVEQINTLQQSGIDIKSYLVMSAATEYKAMNEIIKAFQVFEPQASILTKLDEAATIGSAVSSIIENNLPLSFIADGQQVPEDMHSPCARTLIAQCVAELDEENDYNDVNNEAWAAQGYA
ncbi:MAG: flagellar biosynthesis protein FlhF [Methylobacter sp.]|uniref:flagellar biosynthesis protein FlhF n=2 Tax=Methylobacter sp. TaxID=2051955 RepID=UPI002488A441|nr:flagellar biosynthesis protein FlhF [Methylobacter sp.]MDI1358543.1 flagellar biosynthesis protein FlhF [Methylobacter sp.]